MTAQLGSEGIRCQKCGANGPDLRITTFLWVLSLVLFSQKRSMGGLFCARCRRSECIKYSLLSLLLGPWGIPWGPIWTLEAIGSNSRGGAQPHPQNATMLLAESDRYRQLGNAAQARAFMTEALQYIDDPDLRVSFHDSLNGAGSLQSGFNIGDRVQSGSNETRMYLSPENRTGEPETLGLRTAVVVGVSGEWLQTVNSDGSRGWVKASQVIHVSDPKLGAVVHGD